MMADILVPIASALGAAIAAGASAYRLGSRQATPSPMGTAEREKAATPYVRLTAEDSARVEKISALLERLIALEEQTHTSLDRVASLVIDSRLESAARYGELTGRLGKG